MQKENLQQVSQVTGQYFQVGTISDNGKHSTILKAQELIRSNHFKHITIDQYLLLLLQQFNGNNITKPDKGRNSYDHNLSAEGIIGNKGQNTISANNDKNTNNNNSRTQTTKKVPQKDTNPSTRLELCIRLQKEGNETEVQQLQRQLQELVDQMLRIDPLIKFLPWLNRDQKIVME
jgi:hypothetical protein